MYKENGLFSGSKYLVTLIQGRRGGVELCVGVGLRVEDRSSWQIANSFPCTQSRQEICEWYIFNFLKSQANKNKLDHSITMGNHHSW